MHWQLTKALPKMAKKASNPDLKEGSAAHLRQTEQQVGRLEQAFTGSGCLRARSAAKG